MKYEEKEDYNRKKKQYKGNMRKVKRKEKKEEEETEQKSEKRDIDKKV